MPTARSRSSTLRYVFIQRFVDETPTTPNTLNVPMISQLANPRLASDLQTVALSEKNAEQRDGGLGMVGGAFILSSDSVRHEAITTKTLGRYDASACFHSPRSEYSFFQSRTKVR